MRRTTSVFIAAFVWTAVGVSGQEPLILLDAAHHNVFDPTSRASHILFLETNGYRVGELYDPITPSALADAQVLILRAPLSERNALPDAFTQDQFDAAWSRPVPSALTPSEIDILLDWVSRGGGLLLVFDHMPVAGASRDLAAAFGFEVTDGYAVDSNRLTDLSPPSVAEAGGVVFYREEGTLADHPLTSGIDSIATWTGSAFRVPSLAQSLLDLRSTFVSLLPDTAWVFSDSTPRLDIGGWSQGAVLGWNGGRVAVFAELGILVSPEQVTGSDPAGGGNPQSQNPQLLLNVLHWLSGRSE